MDRIQSFIHTTQGLFQQDFYDFFGIAALNMSWFCSFSSTEVNWIYNFTCSWSNKCSLKGFAKLWNKKATVEMIIWTIKAEPILSLLVSVYIYFGRWSRWPHCEGAYRVMDVTFSKIKSFERLPQSKIRERFWTQHGRRESDDGRHGAQLMFSQDPLCPSFIWGSCKGCLSIL